MFNAQGLEGECKVISELLSDHFALYVELPLQKACASHKRARFTVDSTNRDSFVRQINDWYSTYHPHDVDTFYEDLVTRIVELVDKRKPERKNTSVRRTSNYTKDEQVRAWNNPLRRAHQEWILSGKTEEAKVALQEVAKACSVVRKEAREKYWKSFVENIAATRSLKEIWIEVNKVRGVQRGVKVVGDPQSVADELISGHMQPAGLVYQRRLDGNFISMSLREVYSYKLY